MSASELGREADPEAHRARRRGDGRSRARQVAAGLTFTELLRRPREAADTRADAIGDPDVLRLLLADEVRRGWVDYRGSSRRYVLSGV